MKYGNGFAQDFFKLKLKIKVFKFWLLIILLSLLFFGCNGFYENIVLDRKIQKFIDRGVLVNEEMSHGIYTKFYSVSRETSYELADMRPTLEKVDGMNRIGSYGDVLVSKASPFYRVPGLNEFWTFFFGGHAGLVTDKNPDGEVIGSGKYYLETTGMEGSSKVKCSINDWYDVEDVIGLRIKGATDNDYHNFVNQVEKKLGKPYNYSYIFNNRNSYYCSDLVSTSIHEANDKYSLNDGFITSINDIAVSDDAYIFYYQYISDNIRYVYFLD